MIAVDQQRQKRNFFVMGIVHAIVGVLFIDLLFKNMLYLRIFENVLLGITVSLMTIGNITHSIVSLKCMKKIQLNSNPEVVLKEQVFFCKSLTLNFLLPFIFALSLFYTVGMFAAFTASLLVYITVIFVIYFSDLRPAIRTLSIRIFS